MKPTVYKWFQQFTNETNSLKIVKTIYKGLRQFALFYVFTNIETSQHNKMTQNLCKGIIVIDMAFKMSLYCFTSLRIMALVG